MKVSPHRHPVARVLAAGLIAGALAAPAASAKPAPLETVERGHRIALELESEPAPVVRTVETGFDWDSAAIGAGGAGALLLLVSLGGFTWRSRRQHVGLGR